MAPATPHSAKPAEEKGAGAVIPAVVHEALQSLGAQWMLHGAISRLDHAARLQREATEGRDHGIGVVGVCLR